MPFSMRGSLTTSSGTEAPAERLIGARETGRAGTMRSEALVRRVLLIGQHLESTTPRSAEATRISRSPGPQAFCGSACRETTARQERRNPGNESVDLNFQAAGPRITLNCPYPSMQRG